MENFTGHYQYLDHSYEHAINTIIIILKIQTTRKCNENWFQQFSLYRWEARQKSKKAPGPRLVINSRISTRT